MPQDGGFRFFPFQPSTKKPYPGVVRGRTFFDPFFWARARAEEVPRGRFALWRSLMCPVNLAEDRPDAPTKNRLKGSIWVNTWVVGVK